MHTRTVNKHMCLNNGKRKGIWIKTMLFRTRRVSDMLNDADKNAMNI